MLSPSSGFKVTANGMQIGLVFRRVDNENLITWSHIEKK
jgi:hypothetical protein